MDPNKAAVLAVHPGAYCAGGYSMVDDLEDTVEVIVHQRSFPTHRVLGSGRSVTKAWANAAALLKQSVQDGGKG